MSEKRQYLNNLRGAKLKVQYASNIYFVPKEGIYVDEWDVPEDQKSGIVEHALTTYASVREASGARDRSLPASQWLKLEERA